MAAADVHTSVPDSVPLKELSFRQQWAATFIREEYARIINEAKLIPTHQADDSRLVPVAGTRSFDPDAKHPDGFKVGIIGAGVAGLFTAMIFDYLNDNFKLNVDYEILEAERERYGGRLFTYKFPEPAAKEDKEKFPITRHDYYDVGAMRFPDIKVMDRTFDLFKELKMKSIELEKPLKELKPDESPKLKEDPKPGDLIPYFFKGRNTPSLYNGIQVVPVDGKPTLNAHTFEVPDLQPKVMYVPAGNLVENLIQPLKDLYFEGGPDGPKLFWKELKEQVDRYSARQYLTEKAGFDYNTIEFLETLNYGNRWYDQAASEMVLKSLDFDPDADWWCVEGGSAQIANSMERAIRKKQALELGKVVKEVSFNKKNSDNVKVDVSVDGEAGVRTYDAVFNSAPLGAMQQMHLEGLNLNYWTKAAIRSLGYGASCKVGIRFKTLWWIKDLGIDEGGVAKTDLPIRCCVYPSYNIYKEYDPPDKPGVLLVSYTWSQEAERIGALINEQSPAKEDELKKLLFHDLARLHAKTGDDQEYKRLYDLISDDYLDHYAYDWYKNPRSVGAFAYFGPGQFSNMYKSLIKSDGKHVIIGEAASAHHAWVVGALESAVRGVYQFLWKHSNKSKAARRATQAYNKNEIPAPFGPIPAEYDRTDDIQLPEDIELTGPEDTLPPARGELARAQVVTESARLKQDGDKLDPSKIEEDQLAPILKLINEQPKKHVS
ncbi:MAG: hypothetical protein M1821_002368 [Bathelium mastoideum]|nr:MAG: hypothetical protein M1821_002368 [Bathelium mastoideum]